MSNRASEPTIGVLLPLRIETRFDGPRLRLRVVPDDPWLDRHDPLPRAGELDLLEQYVSVAQNELGTPEARQAWRVLAGRVGGGRAVWLLNTFRRERPDGTFYVDRPTILQETARLPELPFFPEELQVWLARGGAPPTLALTLTVDLARLRADFPDPDDETDRRWWESWDEAVAVGVAGELDLGPTPDDIDVLYVVGLGGGDLEAAALFTAHEAAGRLGMIGPGTPTNSVDAAPAADLARDPETWLDGMLSPTPASSTEVSSALTGISDLLRLPLNDDGQHGAYAEGIVSGLWPALWGFAQKNVWNVAHSNDSAAWAARALRPEGPYPTLRVGNQPYGLLPATALAAWQAVPTDPPVEAAMVDALRVLRDEWAAAAELRGTVEGASTEELLDRLAQVPTSPGYRHRDAHSLQLWLLSMLYLSYFNGWRDVDLAWRNETPLAQALGLMSRRRYAAFGGSATVEIPLVVPATMVAGDTVGAMLHRLRQAARTTPALLGDSDALERDVFRTPPDSLLLRLATRALQLAIGDVGRAKLNDFFWLDQITRQVGDHVPLERWIEGVTPSDLAAGTAQSQAFSRVVDGLGVVADLADDDGPRLERLLRATLDCATYRIDPWVTGPATRRLRDLAAADDGRGWRLGAYGWVDRPAAGEPGPTAAGMLHAPSPSQATAAMVLRDRAVNDAEPQRWHMDLTSKSVRTADRLAASVRAGAHLSEVLGQEVERIVGWQSIVEQLRRDFPIRAEHSGRRVCDGQAVLAADPGALGLPATALAQLAELRTAVDAYGDLLIAEAVYDVVEGRAETAGAVMDAAAGLARPPELSVLRTRREGRAVSTTCVAALPARDEPALPSDPAPLSEVSPGTLVEPAFAAFLTAQLGQSDSWSWTTEPGTSVTLADLGMEPVDALALPLDDLERLAAAAGGGDVVARTGSDRYGHAVRLATLLGQTPAVPGAIAESVHADPSPTDNGVLRQRYDNLRAVAQALLTRLGSPSVSEREAALRAALRWGIAPEAGPGDTGNEVSIRAAELLRARLDASPADASTIEPAELIRALVTLVSPTGQLAVLGRVRRDALPSVLALARTLDREWLTVVAAVREPLARLEVQQLAAPTPASAGPAFTAWSNRVDDPWQTAAPAARLVAVYAAEELDLAALAASDDVAVALLDRFSETIPGTEHSTSVVFGFKAPTSRPPQAILLTVPPDLNTPLDPAGVVAIVAETRLLARARMARPADLDAARALLPTALLPAEGALRVQLDPTTP